MNMSVNANRQIMIFLRLTFDEITRRSQPSLSCTPNKPFTLQVLEELSPKYTAAIIEPELLVNRLDLPHILRLQLKI